MIGVIANPAEHEVVREFFELFKTPWEFYGSNQRYDVVICAGEDQLDVDARLVVIYSGNKTRFDDANRVQASSQRTRPCIVQYDGKRIPIYGDAVSFGDKATSLLTVEGSRDCAAYVDRSGEMHRARVGYDLFDEIRTLLTTGQPTANAGTPTLELHIGFLRELILRCGMALVEIPPVPVGFQFIVCLTHDVDQPSIRQHKCDHTIAGFLFRALFGSVVDAILWRTSIRDAAKNWMAAIKLPFVYIGLAKDFWSDFDGRYLELEKGLPSTFFLIPRKNYPGKQVNGSAPAFRAARYEAKELADAIRRLSNAGCEVALHGIDAWLDASAARAELEKIHELIGSSEIGVRMHWLYYNEQSPAVLEGAGATYDSTVGYNETVGYRAGTTQAYRPLDAKRLMELPLHVMDTALFYPNHLALSFKKASALLRHLTDNAVKFGGCVTINWHDRSLAPERLWGDCYSELIQHVKARGAWFATASQATAWFRNRRSVTFERGRVKPGTLSTKIAVERRDDLPDLRLRVHNPQYFGTSGNLALQGFVDLEIDQSELLSFLNEATQMDRRECGRSS